MGTYYTYGASKKDIIEEITRSESSGDWSRCTLAKSVKSSILWTVEEIKRGETTIVGIGCYLLRSSGEGWGYKPMDEGMHPYFYNCPLKFLDMAPVACQEWRDKVRAEAARQSSKRKLKVGDRVKLNPNTAKLDVGVVESVKPIRVRAENGLIYRIPPRLIAEIVSAA